MLKKDPEGYRKLLAYQRACELQSFTNNLVANFSKTKTFLDLADQMSRSGRSGSKNIVEGWKRNTTKEYYDFLGFSIGAVEELKDDAADIATGVYPALLGVKGVMGEKWVEREKLDKFRFYPLPRNLDPAVELFLRAKEVNYLLYKLQQSLDIKMETEGTKSVLQKARENLATDKQADRDFEKLIHKHNLKRLDNGWVVKSD